MKSALYIRIACCALLSGAAVSVALSSPTRGPQAGPRDIVMIAAMESPEARLAASASFRASDDPVHANCESCSNARPVGPRNILVVC